MPTYLIHGFRWRRESIRIHIILQDLEDAAAEWIVAPATSITLLNSFYSLYDFLPPSSPPPATYHLPVAHEKVMIQDEKSEEPPKLLSKRNLSVKGLRRISSAAMLKVNGQKPGGEGSIAAGKEEQRPKTSAATSSATSMSTDAAKVEKRPVFNDWSAVKLVEQYDPDNLLCASQPYAYVADHMVDINLSASLAEEITKYEIKLKAEEGPLSVPTTPGTPGTAAVESMGDLASPSFSPREQRRRSRRLGWFEKLRDGLEKGGDIGWFVVVCGDEERAIPRIASSTSQLSLASGDQDPQRTPTRSGLRGLFHRKKTICEE